MAEAQKGSSMTLHAHGDGTYHTVSHGGNSWGGPLELGQEPGRVDHQSFGHAVMHMATHHGPPGDHMHIHGHDSGFTAHHVLEGGAVKGPEEMRGISALKRHVSRSMEAE